MLKFTKLALVIFAITLFVFSFTSTVNAQNADAHVREAIRTGFIDGFVPISNAPELGIETYVGNEIPDLNKIVNKAFQVGVSIAGILAVLMILFGGVQYMTTDAISGKQEGKERITHAVMGLLLVLSAWLILNTINTSIVNFRFNVEKVQVLSGEINIAEFESAEVPYIGSGDGTHGAASPNFDYEGNADPRKEYNSALGWPSEYLSAKDMTTRNGDILASGRLLNAFDATREAYGAPITVVSGYRNHKHNEDAKGAESSQHIVGTAVDVRIRDLSDPQKEKLLRSALDSGFLGIGVGPTKMHLDVRENQTTWGYGTGVPPWAKTVLREYEYDDK